MKNKIAKIMLLVILIILLIGTIQVYAVTENQILEEENTTELLNIQESTNNKLAEYADKYGSKTYGLVAWILNGLRIYSIPFCFIGIAVGSIYQYVIGIRRLDTRYKGFYALIAFITILIVCQVLPFIFVVVVKFGRS